MDTNMKILALDYVFMWIVKFCRKFNYENLRKLVQGLNVIERKDTVVSHIWM